MPQTSKGHMRYDRIVAVIVIIVLILIVIARGCVSCARNDDDDDYIDPTLESTESTEETTTEAPSAESLYAGAVYLSPSLQSDHTFATGDTNEAVVCRAIAEKTKTKLENSGLTVILADENTSTLERAAMGDYALGAYVGIQTNQGVGYGTTCYYNAASAQSQALAQAIYTPVSTLTDRDDNGLIDATSGETYYQEIASNHSPCCIIEVEFHDTVTVAQWILDNEDEIADSIAQGICSYLGVTYNAAGVNVSVGAVNDSVSEGDISAEGGEEAEEEDDAE